MHFSFMYILLPQYRILNFLQQIIYTYLYFVCHDIKLKCNKIIKIVCCLLYVFKTISVKLQIVCTQIFIRIVYKSTPTNLNNKNKISIPTNI